MSDAVDAGPVASSERSIVGGKSAQMRTRYLRDSVARWVVWGGGLGVIGALMLIFFYLVSEVMPLFGGATVTPRAPMTLPGGGTTVYLAAEEQGEVGFRLTEAGAGQFFNLDNGEPLASQALPMAGARVSAVTDVNREDALLAVQRTDGDVVLVQQKYAVRFDPQQRRMITPSLAFPYGEAPLAFTATGGRSLAVRMANGQMVLAAVDGSASVALRRYSVQSSLFGDSTLAAQPLTSVTLPFAADRVLLDPLIGWLYVANDATGRIALLSLRGAEPTLVDTVEVGGALRDLSHLAGGISVVAAQADGNISQWFPARRDDGRYYLARVRDIKAFGNDRITTLGVEMRRRTIAVGDSAGEAVFLHGTAGDEVWSGKLLDAPIEALVFNSRANFLMALGADGSFQGFDVHNEHPEVSFSALWQKVWYEGYDEPRWLWQSSAASSDFEPKFSLTPLAFGTLKAAFYAMLFAIPMAILGAIYTANFMSSEMRQAVKPTIELMEALPTVILGFLAGLWLAPFVESNLPGVFLTLVLLPLSIPLFGYLWMRMPRSIRLRVPPGWEAGLLIPVVSVIVWLCFVVAKPIEALAFGGNMQSWMDHTLGIGYDQRNALVVGIAMGVAVIPTIYSITEDAIFSVPKQLSLGSLALGATPWQTLIGVVLPTASPGIFSAVMIGTGRAVGETMIVLMATGNTAVMDFSMFEGLRTMSANIAVEMPESEVGSTHFRLLFLAGLALFLFTFLFNTLAEIVRQRLRQKYASI
ncbi:ABC transporter permease subunit [Flagellatimonas centrodinii]|uniref:ABC transporter permease subunit n=1 Tax=Flagellatimonas centrodinii TaxID=2806210 RepID=UPI001FED7454|nr:ABC transporter permease subunit [Flagellatimonas centrodinii]ULQ45782.1 ABC transporter permease subunit [Flagellatimonas centrodinii]